MGKKRKLRRDDFKAVPLNGRKVCCGNCDEPLFSGGKYIIITQDERSIAVLGSRRCKICGRALKVPKVFVIPEEVTRYLRNFSRIKLAPFANYELIGT